MTVGELLRLGRRRRRRARTACRSTASQADGWLGDLLCRGRRAPARGDRRPRSRFTGTLRPYQERGLAWLRLPAALRARRRPRRRHGPGQDGAAPRPAGRRRRTSPARPCWSARCRWSATGSGRPPGSPRTCACTSTTAPSGRAARPSPRRSPRADLVITTYALAARDAADLSHDRLAPGGRRRGAGDQERRHQAGRRDPLAAGRGTGSRSPAPRWRTGSPTCGRSWSSPTRGCSARPRRSRSATPSRSSGTATSSAAERLRRFTQPFILRRVKTDKSIIADLPEKLEMDVLCNLTAEQAALYQAVVDDMLGRIERSEGIERRGLVLATMTKLKQVCNHPAHFLRDGSRAGRALRQAGPAGRDPRRGARGGGEGAAVHAVRRVRRHAARPPGRRGSAGRCCSCTAASAEVERDAMVARFQAGGPARAAAVRAVAEGRRHRAHADRGQPRRARRPVVEPGRRGPGDRPRLPDRAAAVGAGAQVRLRGHGRGEDRRR